MADNLPLFTRTRTGEFPKPGLERLYNKRFRVTRSIDTMQGASLPPELFIDYGEPDKGGITGYPDLANLCLMEVGTAPGSDPTQKRLLMVFETLTDELVDEVAPVIDTDLNGLRRTTHRLIALPGTEPDPLDADVGVSVYGPDGESILAQLRNESTDAAARFTLVYLEPGVITKSKSSGPASLPNTIEHTWVTWHVDPTTLSPALPGVVTDIRDENVEGYPVKTYSSIAKADGTTPLAVLKTWRDVVGVTKPGIVSIGLYDAGATKRVPYLVTVPPKSGKIDCTITVELTATPPASSIKPTAYNLEDLSVGVASVGIRTSPIGYDEGETITVSVYTDQVEVKQETTRGYYYVDTAGRSGTEFTYEYNAQVIRDEDNIIGETLTATIKTTLTLSGSTSYVAPVVGDVIDIRVEPVFVRTTDGAQIYRITTFKVA